MKQCTKCKKLKSKNEFSKNRKNKDGLRYWCKKCEREYIRRYYRRNRGPVKKHFVYEESHRTIDGVEQKRCAKCEKWKDESKFSKNRKNKDGLWCWCKKCEREYKRRYYRRNRGPVKKRFVYEESHRTIDGVKQKRCTKCEKWKDESKYSKDRYGKDGLSYDCKDCVRAYMRECSKKDEKGLKQYYRYEERHRVVDGVKQKRCSRCKRWKAESDFYKKRQHKDGLAMWCKECSDKATNKARKKRRTAVRN